MVWERQWHTASYKWFYDLLWQSTTLFLCYTRRASAWSHITSMTVPLTAAANAWSNALKIQSMSNLELYRTNEAEAITTHDAVNLVKTVLCTNQYLILQNKVSFSKILVCTNTFPMIAFVVDSYAVMFLRLYELLIVFLKSENIVMLSNMSHKPSAILHLKDTVEQKNKQKIHP